MPIPSAKTCRVCRKPLTRHETFAGDVCSNWRCREHHLRTKLEAHRNEAGVAVGEPAPGSFPIAVVPFRARVTVPVSHEERQELTAFLQSLMAEIDPGKQRERVEPSVSVTAPLANSCQSPPDDLIALLGKVCGVCEGFCCHYGATRHAFLDHDALERFLSRHPDVPAEEAVSHFVAHIPENHCEGSCIYHTDRGCNLPRDMRAAICNEYECTGLRETRRHFADHGSPRVFIVSRQDNRIERSAFVNASEARPYAGPRS